MAIKKPGQTSPDNREPAATTPRIEMVPLEKLKPYENNARTHSPEQVDKLRASLREFGFVNPILVDRDYGIIAGHGRLMAAQAEGMETVPCVFVEHLTETQKRAYILADNKLAELAGWDMDAVRIEIERLAEDGFGIEITGFEFDDIPMGKVADDDFDADAALDDIVEPITKLGNIWQLGRHRLMCGDSTSEQTIIVLMNDQKADVYLTDPPYNVSLGHYGSVYEAKNLHRRTDGLLIANDEMSDEMFIEFLVNAFKAANGVMNEGAAFYIWHADQQALSFRIAVNFTGWNVRQCIIWNKNTFTLGRQDYQWKHEPCLYGWKAGAAHYFIDDRTQSTVFEDKGIDLKKLKKDELLELLQKILSDKVSTTVINEEKPSTSAEHPTMKPIKLLARLIKNSSKQDEIILDSFGGSGSTLIACEQLNRTCYMMELDPKYCDVIIKRWETLTGQKAVLLNG